MQKRNELHVTDREDWRGWLEKNHAREKEIWLIYYKKHTGKPRIPYEDAVEEALCYGWIDSIVKRIDDERYMQKFTPRNERSVWSESNKKRVASLISEGRMTEAGMSKVRAAKVSGQWSLTRVENPGMPEEFESALAANKNADRNFRSLAPSHQKRFVGWIAAAKRSETREKRSAEAIRILEQNQKLGMI